MQALAAAAAAVMGAGGSDADRRGFEDLLQRRLGQRRVVMADGFVEAELPGEAALEAFRLEDHPLFPFDLLIVPVGHLALIQMEEEVQAAVCAGDRETGGGLRVEIALCAVRALFQQRLPGAPELRIEAALPQDRVLQQAVDGLQTGRIIVHRATSFGFCPLYRFFMKL